MAWRLRSWEWRGASRCSPDPASWSVRLRRSVVSLTDSHARILVAALKPMLRPVEEVLRGYAEACRVSFDVGRGL